MSSWFPVARPLCALLLRLPALRLLEAFHYSRISVLNKARPSPRLENSAVIPGPLRSFLRMAGLRQKVKSEEVLPMLARNVLLHGYQVGHPTEYLILLRHYFRQAEELSALAGTDGNIRVNSCNEAGPLLIPSDIKREESVGKRT